MTAVDPRAAGSRARDARQGLDPLRRRPGGRAATVRAYVALTKPRIIELLLVTTVPVMFLAADGLPSLWLVLATLVGGSLAAGGANALNCYLDRDIDRLMLRTGHRPLVTGEISARGALVFGLALSVCAVVWFALTTNLLSAGLAALAIAFYVVGYTLLLKRRTPQNIVWGGAAGCMQVLIGWTAVTGSLAWEPWILFAVLFFWTPPHYWPLSMRFKDDYAAANVPMLPVVASPRRVAIEILAYSWAMVVASLLLVPVADTGPVYLVVALVLGGWFLVEAQRLLSRSRRGLDARPMRLFHLSITYVSLLFLAVAAVPFTRLGT
ncbi:MAG TPA: heme o synthase [Candidatus Nanopelagicales bacterium]|nr:heme o synthase [Candidatus Nanopelagicales bacterium]